MTVGIDPFMHKALRDNHIEEGDETVHLEGRGLEAEMKHQRDARPAEMLHEAAKAPFDEVRDELLKEGALHVVKHGVKATAAAAVEYVRDNAISTMAKDAGGAALRAAMKAVEVPALIAFAGKETISAAWKNVAEGDELHEAAVRELSYAATMSFCRDALPDGFRKEFWDKTVANGDAAMKVAKSLTDQGPAVHDAFVANVRDGQRSALDRGIGTSQELDTALRSNADLRARYEGDLAFRQGVDSAIWAQQHGQADTLRAKLGESAQPAAFQARA